MKKVAPAPVAPPTSIDDGMLEMPLQEVASPVNQALKTFVESKRGHLPEYLYQSATIVFHYDVLLEQFLVHIFNPLSRIYLARKYGPQAVKNQFGGGGCLDILPHFYWLVALLYLIFRDDLIKGGITDAEVAISFFAGSMLRLTIATKYASMTTEEYMTLLMCEDLDKAIQYQTNTQLVTGWLSIDIPFCLHESNLALARMGFSPPGTSENDATGSLPPCFEVKCSEITHWKSILGESASVLHTKEGEEFGNSETVNVDVADLMALIVAASDYNQILPYFIPPVVLIIITWSLLPCIVRVSCNAMSELVTYDNVEGLCKSNNFFGDGPLANFFSVILMINTFIVSFPLYMFFVATILGSIRHQRCANIYGLLARIDRSSPTVDKCPIIDMRVHTNIRAWVRSMLALHFFGSRYYQRVDMYAKLCALILVGLLIWLYIFSLQVNEEATGANELILDIRYWSVCFLLIMWGGAFATILAIMSDTNFALKQHEVTFLLHRLSVREKRGHAQRVSSHMLKATNEARTSMLDPKSEVEVTKNNFMGLMRKMSSMIENTNKKNDGVDDGTGGSNMKKVMVSEKKKKGVVRKLPKRISISELEEIVRLSNSIDEGGGEESDKEGDKENKREDIISNSIDETGESESEEEDTDLSKKEDNMLKIIKIESEKNNIKKDQSPKQDQEINEKDKDEKDEDEDDYDEKKEKGREARRRKTRAEERQHMNDMMSDMDLKARWLTASQNMENEQLDDLMDTAVMILESQMRINPRRFLGASASWNLVKSFTFAWASLIAFSLTVAGINYSA